MHKYVSIYENSIYQRTTTSWLLQTDRKLNQQICKCRWKLLQLLSRTKTLCQYVDFLDVTRSQTWTAPLYVYLFHPQITCIPNKYGESYTHMNCRRFKCARSHVRMLCVWKSIFFLLRYFWCVFDRDVVLHRIGRASRASRYQWRLYKRNISWNMVDCNFDATMNGNIHPKVSWCTGIGLTNWCILPNRGDFCGCKLKL